MRFFALKNELSEYYLVPAETREEAIRLARTIKPGDYISFSQSLIIKEGAVIQIVVDGELELKTSGVQLYSV